MNRQPETCTPDLNALAESCRAGKGRPELWMQLLPARAKALREMLDSRRKAAKFLATVGGVLCGAALVALTHQEPADVTWRLVASMGAMFAGAAAVYGWLWHFLLELVWSFPQLREGLVRADSDPKLAARGAELALKPATADYLKAVLATGRPVVAQDLVNMEQLVRDAADAHALDAWRDVIKPAH